MDIITGEIIQFQCHHYLGNKDDFDYNPKKVLTILKI